ncbi:helix-turn-helix domain-containing protein [Rathayibacter sp. VKM Ac-2803]|uniref:helix-turn-helix domain-containing protein n=1 Tax=unclassified Rathayibacter TaxID=2609250 RepID=UPI00135AA6D7|nr:MULTISPECIES: helix-turn-helix domain-containing protein [unclassified Rathayibacter]MWV48340.1 helix-turn-helix domain-containing protein [Rathayibacter sp. VKM Ac-2803]MWV59168.1 helix-turn-helix domain-containing protein [Rathayibacter sp. VKM Ac-2754]
MTRIRTAEDVGAIIRARRRRLELTQQELAQRAGVSRQLIVALEHGKERAALSSLLRVLLELDLDVDLSPSGAGATDSEREPAIDLSRYLSGFIEMETP